MNAGRWAIGCGCFMDGRAWIVEPSPPARTLLWAALLTLFGAAYCFMIAYTQGECEHFATAAAWAATALLPWLFAFEAAKSVAQVRRSALGLWLRLLLIAAAAAIVSILADQLREVWLFHNEAPRLALLALRKLPPAALVTGAVLLLVPGRPTRVAAPVADALPPQGPWPLPLEEVERVTVAGNYLEFRGRSQVRLLRMPLHCAEPELKRAGFVRVHRSFMVRRSAIVRMLQGKKRDELILASGACVRVGALYRTTVRMLPLSR
jgi:DNA-binding LytR/AlgR family response regulator